MTATSSNEKRSMIDRADTETVLYRVAICAFTYFPGKEEEPGYTVDEDVAWCLAPIAAIPADRLEQMRATTRRLITDPNANRREFLATLAQLAEGH